MLPVVPQRHNSHTQISATGKDFAEKGERPPIGTVAPVDCLRRTEGVGDPQQQGRRRGRARRRHVTRLTHPTTEVSGEGQQLALMRGTRGVVSPPRLRDEEGVGVIETAVVVPRAGLCPAVARTGYIVQGTESRLARLVHHIPVVLENGHMAIPFAILCHI